MTQRTPTLNPRGPNRVPSCDHDLQSQNLQQYDPLVITEDRCRQVLHRLRERVALLELMTDPDVLEAIDAAFDDVLLWQLAPLAGASER